MTPATYEKLFGSEPDYNSILLKLNDTGSDAQSRLATETMKYDACVNISFTTDLQKTIDDMLKALHYVIWVIIIAAGLLAFVVLYNLNNINITERMREKDLEAEDVRARLTETEADISENERVAAVLRTDRKNNEDSIARDRA